MPTQSLPDSHPSWPGRVCTRRENRQKQRGVGADGVHRLERAGTDPFGLVMFHTAASYYAMGADDLATARAQAESALDLARRIENPSAIACALFNLARSIEHDDPVRALDAVERAIALGRAGAMPIVVGMALVDVARWHSRMGDRVAALEALYDAISYANHAGSRGPVVEVLGAGAEILLRAGELSAATVLAGSLLQGALLAILVSQRDAELKRALMAAHEGLGDEQYQRMFDRGASMSYEEVITFALDNVQRAMAETTNA